MMEWKLFVGVLYFDGNSFEELNDVLWGKLSFLLLLSSLWRMKNEPTGNSLQSKVEKLLSGPISSRTDEHESRANPERNDNFL